MASLLTANYVRGVVASPSSPMTQTGSAGRPGLLSTQRASMQNHAQITPHPSQRHTVSMPASNTPPRANYTSSYATMQIQSQPAQTTTHLMVPSVQVTPSHQPQMIFTNEQGTHYNPNGMLDAEQVSLNLDSFLCAASVPWLITSNIHDPSYQETSPMSSTFLSPGSPYASSIFSSGSSLDDGLWDQGPPSPSYFSNDLFFDSTAPPQNPPPTSTSTSTVTVSSQGSYGQPQIFPQR